MFSRRAFVFLLNLFLGVFLDFVFLYFISISRYLFMSSTKKTHKKPLFPPFCQLFLVLAALHCQYYVAKTVLNNDVTSSNQPFSPAFPLAFGFCKLIGPQAHVHPEGKYCRGLQFPHVDLACLLSQVVTLAQRATLLLRDRFGNRRKRGNH